MGISRRVSMPNHHICILVIIERACAGKEQPAAPAAFARLFTGAALLSCALSPPGAPASWLRSYCNSITNCTPASVPRIETASLPAAPSTVVELAAPPSFLLLSATQLVQRLQLVLQAGSKGRPAVFVGVATRSVVLGWSEAYHENTQPVATLADVNTACTQTTTGGRHAGTRALYAIGTQVSNQHARAAAACMKPEQQITSPTLAATNTGATFIQIPHTTGNNTQCA
jgi:hypothetical protein